MSQQHTGAGEQCIEVPDRQGGRLIFGYPVGGLSTRHSFSLLEVAMTCKLNASGDIARVSLLVVVTGYTNYACVMFLFSLFICDYAFVASANQK